MHVGYTGVHGYNLQLKNLSKKLYVRPNFFFLFFFFLKIILSKKRGGKTSSSRAQNKESFFFLHTYILILLVFFLLLNNLAHPHRTNNVRLRNLHRQTRHPPPIPPSILPPRNPLRHLLGLPYPNLAQFHLLRRLRLPPHFLLHAHQQVLETLD